MITERRRGGKKKSVERKIRKTGAKEKQKALRRENNCEKAEAVIKKKSERFIEAMAEKMRYENEIENAKVDRRVQQP